jgi:hypothetical protein
VNDLKLMQDMLARANLAFSTNPAANGRLTRVTLKPTASDRELDLYFETDGGALESIWTGIIPLVQKKS